ncbi:MAG TPA: amino acid adenylation domain-containing protein [Isosphaeraceae bacterium]|nr:amino acid adenylation domain-containing protein [Isosphaeraceae bacterium]
MSSNVAPQAADRSPEEKRALLARRLRGKGRAPRRSADSCLHHAFEAQAARTPDAVALEFEDRRLTYRELNAWANRISHRLRALGVGPEVLVGLCVERSPEMVAGLLGILKAGGAYVPIDPSQPTERLAFILDDARVAVVLTQQALASHFEGHGGRLIFLDAEPDLFAPERSDDPDHVATPDNLAYVIYTSGSTGKPKGVPVTHANVSRLFRQTQHWFHFGPSDVWTLFHSFAFDFSVWEIWGALLYGGRLVVVPYWVSRSPEAFRGLLRDRRVTVLNQTPSAFRQLIRAEEALDAPADDLALRLVIFGGEALDPRSLAPWFDRHGDRTPQLVNMYGITETTVHVTYRPISAGDVVDATASSPIGRAIPDLKVYVLDRRMEPVPVGVAGEMYVGGFGLARGYLNRPGLTAERFLPDPFGKPGARLYRSGDLARRRPDGGLDYLGRADDQVKVRGFRIELGEVEAALLRDETVREAVVVARPDENGDTRLIAYVVGRGPARPDPAGLRAQLKGTLPAYMVPAAFVPLDALPLTPHGKVDRRALPEPVAGDRHAAAFVAPRTPTEEVVAGIWAGLLGLDRVGVRDDFFALGGHSLLATRVASRLRSAFGVELPLRALFEATTVEALATRIDASRGSSMAIEATPIVPVAREGSVATSSSQEALWFLDRLAPGRPTFNVGASVRVVGPLDRAALLAAFDEIARRHEALRTTFAVHDGRPVQVIAPSLTIPLDEVDLRDHPDEAARIAAEESRRPFDLERGPLVRAVVARLGDDDHAVILTMHHIVTDGWSFGVAARELGALYAAFAAGEPSPLPPLAIQYVDYAAWQRDRLRGPALDALLDHWTRRLDGLTPLALPADRPRPAVRSGRGAPLPFELSAELSASVLALGRREGVTPFMTLLTAFQALLARSSGQEDIAVGTPVANRARAEVEPLIGYFVNMLVLRADLSGDPTVREALARVRSVALDAFEHQELPLETLVQALRPTRDPGRSPLFDVMFVLQNNAPPESPRDDLVITPLDVRDGNGTAKFDLTLAMAEADGRLVGSFEYSLDLFDESTVARLLRHFRALLTAMVADPDARLSSLPLIDADGRRLLVDDWGVGTRVAPVARHRVGEAARGRARSGRDLSSPRDPGGEPPGPPGGYAQLFEEQAARTPDLIAVECRGIGLSYREFNGRANRLARRLVGLGVGPGVPVGIGLERSPGLAVALLGVLKAGGAFLPLDPAEPRDRLARILADARPRVVLSQEHLSESFTNCSSDVFIFDDVDDDDPADLSPSARPDDAAYILYTSGTTGMPKGVVVSHRNLINHNHAVIDLFGLAPEDRVLQFAALGSDISIEELFPTWLAGATAVLRDGDEWLDPAEFTRRVDRDRIGVVDLPTAFWHAWAADLAGRGGGIPEALRLVVVGGERALPSAFACWRAAGGDRVRWINTYGPTEATVIATAFEPPADPEARDRLDVLPIGRPIAGARVYVLDSRGEPVPVGLPGELFIGGAGVARGYLNRPVATAESFVPDPFGDPGDRLFRTGDRARWRADGQLEFLGRLDDQVKIRGIRVEPGEVESALLSYAGVREAAVVFRAEEQRLDAYVVPRDGLEIDKNPLHHHLKERLPASMVPATISVLPSLPRTSSGKLDRKALPRTIGRVEDRPIVPPGDEVEAALAGLWEDALGMSPIGVDDDFFDLGGHSMLAVRLLGEIESRFGRRLPLATFFHGGTIADVARALRESAEDRPRSPLVTLRGTGTKPPFACVHPAGGIVFRFAELARQLGDDRPFLAFQAPGLEGECEPIGDVGAMAERYVEALRRRVPEGPYHLGGWSFGGLVAFEMARRLEAAGGRVATLALFDTEAPTLEKRDEARRLASQIEALDAEQRREFILNNYEIREVYDIDILSRDPNGPGRVARLLDVLRASVVAGLKYEPGPYSGPLTLFVARDRPGVSRDDPTLGWGRYARGGVESFEVAGDHATILRAPAVADVARWLRDAIERGEGRWP